MPLLFTCSLLGPLASACVFDLRERRIPNRLLLLMTVLWTTCMLLSALCSSMPLSHALSGLLGGTVFAGSSFALAMLCERTGQAAFGGGDVKLLFVLGLYLGVNGGLICLLIACIAAIGLAVIIPRTRFAHVPNAIPGQIPFAPALFIGASVVCMLV